jgi:SAM-dependent methyltransferase
MTTTTALSVEGRHFDVAYHAERRGEECFLHGLATGPRRLPTGVWDGDVSASDRALLAHCTGATLDVGCGPGRMAGHLARRGVQVLGVDVSEAAVVRARTRGVAAVCRDVFGPLPGEGRWFTALLADGNIGIGGEPERLLARLRVVLAPGGRVVADLAAPGTGLCRLTATLEHAGAHGEPFPWALVGPEALPAVARGAGLHVQRVRAVGGRWFAVLEARR